MADRVKCECGRSVHIFDLARHRSRQIHERYMNRLKLSEEKRLKREEAARIREEKKLAKESFVRRERKRAASYYKKRIAAEQKKKRDNMKKEKDHDKIRCYCGSMIPKDNMIAHRNGRYHKIRLFGDRVGCAPDSSVEKIKEGVVIII